MFNKNSKIKDIFVVHYGEVKGVPPIMELTNYLYNKHYNVVLQGRKGGHEFQFCDFNVPIFYYGNYSHTGILQYLDYIIFSFGFCFNILKFKPHIIIAMNHQSFLLSILISKLFSLPLIYWKLEISGEKRSIFERIFFVFEKKFIKYTDIMIFPNKERVEDFFKDATARTAYIAFNAVSKRYKRNYMQGLKITNKKSFLIGRQGGLGDSQCIMELINSLPLLPDNVNLLLIGFCSDNDFLRKLTNQIGKLKLENRIKIMLDLPRQELFSLLPKFDVGIALYRPETKTTRLSGSASMKLAEYISSSTPAIVNDNKVMRELNEKVGSFVFADPYSPESIAEAIKEIIKNPNKAKRLQENAKRAFETFYNFEYQFEPILKEIEKWVKR